MKNMVSPTVSRNHATEIKNLGRGNDLNSLMNYFWNYFDTPNMTADNSALGELQPHMEVIETKDAVNITAELPGIATENLDVQISSDGYLSVCGEKKNAYEESDKESCFSEISYGTFKRTLPLPWDLDYDKAQAKYADGVLCVSIPKSPVEKQKFKKISITKN